MRWKRRHRFGLIFLLVFIPIYVYLFHRSTDVRDDGSWHLRYTYQPFHCRVCLGFVKALTHDGTNVPIPRWDWTAAEHESPLAVLHTPVGVFRAFEESERWHIYHGEWPPEDAGDPLTADELARGWYDPREAPDDRVYPVHSYPRRPGMPDDWCLLATNTAVRWVRADLIANLQW